MRKLILAVLLAGAATTAQAATYISSHGVGAGTVAISITTDDTIGTLTKDNILDWTISVGSNGATFNLFGPDSGDNSRIELRGSALSATATNLLFDFSAAGQAYLLFQSTEGDRSLYCVQTVNCFDQTRGEEIVSLGNTFTNFQRATRSGTLSIASVATAAVPEPAAWAMMVGGFGMVGGAMRSRRKMAVRFA